MKDLKISKKLISEVLKIPLDVINEVYFDKTNLLVRKLNNRIEEHNIYEFAFKCKEWALINGRIIGSRTRDYCVGKGFVVVYKNNWTSEFSEHYLKSFSSSTEIEAIIKACEWILENEKNPK